MRKTRYEHMKITQVFAEHDVTISFEVFPPKTDDKFESVVAAANQIAALHPAFMSVTYGAGGNRPKNTAAIAAELQNSFGIPVLAHLTCVSSTRETVLSMVQTYQELGIENVMALRGDLPKEGRTCFEYDHAIELIHDIREAAPDLCLGGACYPETHVETESPSQDIQYLKEKVDAGLDFLTTQMFFDNNMLYNFLYRVRMAGITVPVLPGIMPITRKSQVARSVQLSGSTIPPRFRMMVDRFGNDPAKMKQAGVIYATEQIIDLIANGVTHIHVYSMNKPDVAAGIMASLSEILR